MNHMPALDGPRRPPASGRKAAQLIVFLHGYGADGHDLIGLADRFADLYPEAAFVSPHAPEGCEANPFGRQWFSLAYYDPEQLRRNPVQAPVIYERLLQGAEEAAPALNAFLDDETARLGLQSRHRVVIGFSQGAMMALYTGLRRPDPDAAVIAFSGALVGAERLSGEMTARPPVLLVHGDADTVVPVQAMQGALQGLQAAGLEVESHISPGGGHGIGLDGLEVARRFLQRHLVR